VILPQGIGIEGGVQCSPRCAARALLVLHLRRQG
jgi:hypothetical protein